MMESIQIYTKLIGPKIDGALLPQHPALGQIKTFKNVPRHNVNISFSRSSATAFGVDALQEHLDFLEKNDASITAAGVTERILYLTVFCRCGEQCNTEYSLETLRRIVDLGASLAITYANPV